MRFELMKIVRNKVFKLSAILFILILIICMIGQYNSYSYLKNPETDYPIKGVEAIEGIKKSYSNIKGELKQDILNKTLSEYKKYSGSELSDVYVDAKYPGVLNLLYSAYGEYESVADNLLKLKNVDDFYNRNEIGVKKYLLENGKTTTEVDAVLNFMKKIKKPFNLDYTKQWENLWKALNIMLTFIVFISIILSSYIFSKEKELNMNPIFVNLREKNKKMISKNKIMALCSVISMMHIVSFVVLFLFMCISIGVSGWNSQIQISYFYSIVNMNFLPATIIYFFVSWICLISIIMIISLIDILLQKSLSSLVISSIIIFLPKLIINFVKLSFFEKLLRLHPILGIDLISMLKHIGVYNLGVKTTTVFPRIALYNVLLILFIYYCIPRFFIRNLKEV